MSSSYPIGEFDAMLWAEEFVKRVKENPDIATDEGTMLAWFAGALMTGHGKMLLQREECLEAIRLTQEFVLLPCREGWSWWDVYSKYRPEDAERLRRSGDPS